MWIIPSLPGRISTKGADRDHPGDRAAELLAFTDPAGQPLDDPLASSAAAPSWLAIVTNAAILDVDLGVGAAR